MEFAWHLEEILNTCRREESSRDFEYLAGPPRILMDQYSEGDDSSLDASITALMRSCVVEGMWEGNVEGVSCTISDTKVWP